DDENVFEIHRAPGYRRAHVPGARLVEADSADGYPLGRAEQLAELVLELQTVAAPAPGE
ncbi:MAG: hypothetical protein QOF43_1188, partial [Gaiellaceae bacterium]|nr:hypothetical protein [Gaiellaceae bacterium]